MTTSVTTSKHCYQARFVTRGDNVVRLAELSWVFDCPACEYVMTARTPGEIDTVETMHYKISPSRHGDLLKEKNWEQTPLAAVPETVDPAGEHFMRAQTGPGWRG